MTYTKPWTQEDSAADCAWHMWLSANAHSGLDYQLLYWEDHITVEFYDPDLAEEFAMELGL